MCRGSETNEREVVRFDSEKTQKERTNLEDLLLDQQSLPALSPAVSDLEREVSSTEEDDERVQPGREDLSDGVVREGGELILEHEERVETLPEDSYT